jgi:tRNA_anti-like
MKRKTLRTIGLICLVCIVTGAVIAYRMYNKPHRSAAEETAVVLTAAQLSQEYEKDEPASNKKYLGNAVQVNGTVSEVSVNQQKKPVILLTGSDMSGVQCSLLEEAPGIKKGDNVTIKGFCTGYLTDVIMDRCILVH